MEKEKIAEARDRIVPFEPPLSGVAKNSGRPISITGYLPAQPPQFRCLDGNNEFLSTGEEIIIDEVQLFAPAPEPRAVLKQKGRRLSAFFKEKIKRKLMQEAAHIRAERDSTIYKFREETKNTSQRRGGNHPADLDNDPTAEALFAGKAENSDKRLWKISLALVRLENGLYGICKFCGEEIPLKRLNEIPYADSHAQCKGVGHRGRVRRTRLAH